MKPLLYGAGLIASCGLLVMAQVVTSHAEVTTIVDAPPPATPVVQKTIPAVPVHDGEGLQVQCWQEGVKIIEQRGLNGVSLSAATQSESVSFKRTGDPQPSVFLLPFKGDSLCLVQPVR